MALARDSRIVRPACVVALACVLAVCAARGAWANDHDHDPLEPVNRKIFWFNDHLDMWVLEPVARGWDKVAPDRVQRCVANFFGNLRFPIAFVNNILQAKPTRGVKQVGRFAVNTTVGVVGLFDPASDWGLEAYPEDFGQTLGWWGVPPGPYLVLPILGPSNPRDGIGLAADSAASVTPFFVDQFILLGASAVDAVNTRALFLQALEEAKRTAVDYYSFVRNAYVQRRARLVADRLGPSASEQESLYYPDADDDK